MRCQAVAPEPAIKRPNPEDKRPARKPPNADSPDRRLSFNFVEVKACPAHPSRSKSFANLATSDPVSNSLRPCLRHKRHISQSCDDLLANSSLSKKVSAYKSGTVSSNVSVCSGSISSGAGKSVKFLLPEKKLPANYVGDAQMRRFSSGALVPSAAAYRWSSGIPYYNKYWQNFGAQFLFGQNFDRYLWGNVCCPCYQCCQLPYSYCFGHFSSQYSLTRPTRVKSIERISDIPDTNLGTSESQGTFLSIRLRSTTQWDRIVEHRLNRHSGVAKFVAKLASN